MIDGEGRLEAFNDPRVPPIGTEDALIGVQNDSDAPVRSIQLTSASPQIFRFDGNGICSARYAGAIAGCPFGRNDYEGPGTEFLVTEALRASAGSVEFTGEGLSPGASTYFDLEGISLEGLTELACGPELASALEPEPGHEGCHPLTPTSLATTLSGGGRVGTRQLAVADGTAATDQATLSVADGSSTTGAIEYAVYSDPQCAHLVATAGTFPLSGVSVPPSSAETLTPGTYYWQATYSGDPAHAGSQSPCDQAVEFVQPECTAAHGVGHLGPRGPQGLNEANRLDVSGAHHRLTIAEPGLRIHLLGLTSAACVQWREFTGAGPAEVNGAGGYLASFAIEVGVEGVFLTATIEKQGATVLELSHQRLSRHSREYFA